MSRDYTRRGGPSEPPSNMTVPGNWSDQGQLSRAGQATEWLHAIERFGLSSPPASVRPTDPDTSVSAAVGPPGARRFRRGMAVEAFADIAAAGPYGRTTDELCAAHPTWDRGTAARRVTDLTDAGHVVDSGMRRLTRRGCEAIAWVAVEHGAPVPAALPDEPPALVEAVAVEAVEQGALL